MSNSCTVLHHDAVVGYDASFPIVEPLFIRVSRTVLLINFDSVLFLSFRASEFAVTRT